MHPEFVRQLENLVVLGYPALMGRSEAEFRATLSPLAAQLDEINPATAVEPSDHIPFLLVVSPTPLAAAAKLMTLRGKPAALMLEEEEIASFTPTADTSIPDSPGYLLIDVDTGSEFCNVRPSDALPVITDRTRTPLTIAEGIALVTHRPDMLRKNKCFSLLGSRCGDKRVPAIWISAAAPKLGWCWNGNPHTWLGSASAGQRMGAAVTTGR
jgi:hypothetical protein